MRHALEYIENFCIKVRDSKSKTVHNMAIFFHAKIDYGMDNEKNQLIKFLENKEFDNSKNREIYFEVDYALNICKQNEKELIKVLETKWVETEEGHAIGDTQIAEVQNKILIMKKAQIIIYAILSHFDKAVKIALECGDTNMAMRFAQKPKDNNLKKKLLMKVAKYLFNYNGKQDKYSQRVKELQGIRPSRQFTVSEALQELQEKLKVDDLLPLFPPDEKVHTMKDHLCKCLSKYKTDIEVLKQDLEELAINAEELRGQQRKMKHKNITINPSQTCDLCFKSIFEKERFYMFPCEHAFHRSCILKRLDNYKSNNPSTKKRLNELKKLLVDEKVELENANQKKDNIALQKGNSTSQISNQTNNFAISGSQITSMDPTDAINASNSGIQVMSDLFGRAASTLMPGGAMAGTQSGVQAKGAGRDETHEALFKNKQIVSIKNELLVQFNHSVKPYLFFINSFVFHHSKRKLMHSSPRSAFSVAQCLLI